MEYIEPKPKEVKPHAKRNKKILISTISAALALSIATGSYFLITKVFMNYDNVELYTFNYDNSDPKSEATITAVKESIKLPKTLRLPAKFKGHPVTAVEDKVFLRRQELVRIVLPDSLKKIGNSCFSGCSNLAKINVPKSLEVLGTDAFYDTAWLNNMPDNSPVEFGQWLYTYKGKMTPNSAVLPSESSPNASKFSGVKIYLDKFKYFSRGVFKNQGNLVYAEFPGGFPLIQESLFDGCTGLKELILPSDVKTIESYAFRNCVSLKVDNFGEINTLETLGDYAFSNTKIGGEIKFPDSLKETGEGSFSKCKEITKVNFGETRGLEYISDRLFEDCLSLEEVKFSDNELSGESHLSYVGEAAFKNTIISEFKIPFNAVDIRAFAFSDCPNLTTVYALNNTTGLQLNTLNTETGAWEKSDSTFQGPIRFGTYVFSGSSNFKELVLVDKDGNNVSAANEVTLPVTTLSLGGRNDDAHLFSGTSITTIHLGRDLSSVTSQALKDYLANVALTILPPSVCEGASKLSTVDFGGSNATITTIGRDAFKECNALVSVTLPNTITTISTGVFENCDLLETVTLSSSDKTVSENEFRGCVKLSSIILPKSFTSIAANAFAGCTALETFVLEDESALANIYASAFEGCTALKNITLQNNIKSFGKSSAFKGCSELKSFTVQGGTVNAVTVSMFENDVKLESVDLCASVWNIEDSAFANAGSHSDCPGLSLTLRANRVVSLTSLSFSGANVIKLYVPAGQVDNYKANANWTSVVDPANIVAIA